MNYWDALQNIVNARTVSTAGRANSYESQDAAANAKANAPITGNAELWGNPIPITWGRRRITGQLLQIGPQYQKTEVTQYKIYTGVDSDIIPIAGGYASAINEKTETRYHSTFAYCFGAPGNKNATQILTKLWFNNQLVYDINSGQLSNEVRFKFYPGDETQTPDDQLNSGGRYTYPVAYRGLMYIVFYDYSIAGQATKGNPTVEAEFAEQLSFTNPVTRFSTYGGPLNISLREPAIDPKKGVVYVAGANLHIYKFNIATRQLVSDYRVTQWPQSGQDIYEPAFSILAFARLNNTPYLFCTASASNSQQVVMINADTGIVVASFGSNSNSLTPSNTNVVAPWGGNARVGYYQGQQAIFLSINDLFNSVYLFRCTEGQITHLAHYTEPTRPSGAIVWPHDGTVSLIYSRADGVYVDGALYYTVPTTIRALFYVPADNSLVIMSQNAADLTIWDIRKITLDGAKTVKWTFNYSTHGALIMPIDAANFGFMSRSNTGGDQRIAWDQGTYFAFLDMLSGTFQKVPRDTTSGGNIGTYVVFDAFTNTLIGMTGSSVEGTSSISSVPIFNSTTGTMSLATFLHDVAILQGYEEANIMIEGISDIIIGAAITQQTDIDAMLDDVRRCYNFQIIKTGRFIRFTRRNYGTSLTVDASYTEDQRAILSDDDDASITVTTEVASPAQTAGTIILNYIDPNYNYSVVPFTYKRNDPQADQSVTLTLNIPIIMPGSDAAALAARALVDSNANGTTQEFRLPQAGLAHEPGDLIELIYDDYSEVVRAVEVSYNGDWSLSFKSEAVYTQEGPTYEVPSPILPPEPPSLLSGEGAPLILDTTLIRASDQLDRDALEIYLSSLPAGRLPIVGSSQVNKSIDNTAMAPVATLPDAISLGQLLSTMTSGPVLQVNYDESLTFRLVQGVSTDFHTDTLLNMLAGKNRVLIGQAGRWEQVGYITAAFDSNTQIVTLTGLVRGWRGTELFAGLHQPGDYVIPVPDNSVVLTSDLPSDLGKQVVYVVSDNMLRLNYADAQGTVIAGITRRPWAPYNVHVVASAGDLAMSWKRRTRLTGPLNNGSGTVPLDETVEAYRLIIYRAGAAVRTVELTAPNFTYTAAMQTADGWSGSIAQIQLDVMQISSLVGPGFIKAGTYDVE